MNGSQKTRQPVKNISDLFSSKDKDEKPKDIAFLKEYEEQSMELLNSEGEYLGPSTGYAGIDELLGSLLPGEILTIGGDTGHGKSILAMNIAQNVYKETKKPVLFINLELTVEQAVQRFYHMSGDSHDYGGIMVQNKLDLDYKDVDKLMLQAKEAGAGLVIVDHIHFFDDSMGDKAHQAITRIMKHFKKCAIEHEIPVILLSHITPQTRVTNAGTIETLKPDLHSFKGSKSIEQVSDMVGFVLRDKKNPAVVYFYLRKNRSRQLFTHDVPLLQMQWNLVEYKEWSENDYSSRGN